MAEPTQRTPSRDLEAALVDAAERVLVRDGLRGLTVRAVATEAGVAPMGVYNRFGSSYRRFALANPQHYEAMFGSGASSTDRAAAFSDETKGHATAAFGVLVD